MLHPLAAGASGGASLAGSLWTRHSGGAATAFGASRSLVDPRASLYGRWIVRGRLPAFAYEADHETLAAAEWDPIVGPRTRRHWVMLGNRAISLQAANDGTVALSPTLPPP